LLISFSLVEQQSVHAHTRIDSTSSAAFTPSDLIGEWSSVGCESTKLIGVNTGNAFFQRFYVFSETNFNVRYSYFADAICQKPLFSIRINGWSELGRVRHDLPNTREALVVYSTVLLTADSSAGRQAVKSCGTNPWTVGQEYDITASGCLAAGIKPRTQCIGDYELVRVERNVYYPGFRTSNMCIRSGRPTHTQTVGARKVFPET
jgi:hypothetical protein